jgi:hypothetical protein
MRRDNKRKGRAYEQGGVPVTNKDTIFFFSFNAGERNEKSELSTHNC